MQQQKTVSKPGIFGTLDQSDYLKKADAQKTQSFLLGSSSPFGSFPSQDLLQKQKEQAQFFKQSPQTIQQGAKFGFGGFGSPSSPFGAKSSRNVPEIQTEKLEKKQELKKKQLPAEVVKPHIIEDELLKKGAPITCKWVTSDELCVYPYRNPTTENIETTSEFYPCDTNLHILKKTDILNDPELRKLVNESQAIFFASRNIATEDNSRYRALERSREHRSSIRVCIEEMHQAMQKYSKVNYNEWIGVLENIEIVWHLCELLYLEVVQSDVVLPKLLQWTRLSSVDYDEVVQKELSLGKGADIRNKGRYWKQIMNLLVESRFDTTRAFLRLHSEADTKPFLEADILLRAIPIYTFRCGLSPAEFNSRWKAWKATVRSKISTGTFVSHPELLNVMNVLGSQEPLHDVLKPHCDSWYQMMTAVVQFTDPMTKCHDLNFVAKKCIQHFGGVENLKLLDQTILDLLDGNLASAIAKLLMTADNGLSAVHLTNLLHIRGCLNKSPETTVKLEPLFLNYGLFLMSHKRFWQIGLSYLKICPQNGKDAMAIKLTSLPLKDDRMILKLTQAAKDNGLHSVANSICRTVSMQHIKQGSLADALTWALLSKDVELLNIIADKYLYRYSTGTSEKLNVHNSLSGLGQSIFISSRLTFLCKYCDFQSCYQRGEIKEAAAIIIRLLDSKIAPKYFWFTLLLDALPILEMEGNTKFFSNDDCTILLACLEELAVGWIDNPVNKSQNFNEQIQIIRLAITKTFAKTLLHSDTPANSNVLICY